MSNQSLAAYGGQLRQATKDLLLYLSRTNKVVASWRSIEIKTGEIIYFIQPVEVYNNKKEIEDYEWQVLTQEGTVGYWPSYADSAIEKYTKLMI